MERAGPEGVVEAARHAAGPFGSLGLALDHLPGRGPSRPFGFASDVRVTIPPEPVATEIGAIASGGSVALDTVDVVIPTRGLADSLVLPKSSRVRIDGGEGEIRHATGAYTSRRL